MSKSINNSAEIAQERAQRLQSARKNVLDGSIGALSLDTCIFSGVGYRLESDILKRLEQFKGDKMRLVFSEITIREVFKHITKLTEDHQIKLVSALRGAGKTWLVSQERQSAVLADLIEAESAKAMVTKRFKDFETRCGFTTVFAKDTLDVPLLLKLYFNVQTPFENTERKKAEFPDAIALLTLQSWAKKNSTKVLFITKDKGCQRFCLESERLLAIDRLDDALALIQERDAHRAELCKKIESEIRLGAYPHLTDQIHTIIAEKVWDIDWQPDATADYYYEAEMQDIDVINVEFPTPAHSVMKVVDFRDDVLVIQATVSIVVEASCSFSFSTRDSIDRDMVNVGDDTVTRNFSVDVAVLLSFEDPIGQTPIVTEIELVTSRHDIDFGSVEPDYGNEDPNVEDY